MPIRIYAGLQLFRATLEKKSVGFSHHSATLFRCLIQVALFVVHRYEIVCLHVSLA
jgi:hypothetical protein